MMPINMTAIDTTATKSIARLIRSTLPVFAARRWVFGLWVIMDIVISSPRPNNLDKGPITSRPLVLRRADFTNGDAEDVPLVEGHPSVQLTQKLLVLHRSVACPIAGSDAPLFARTEVDALKLRFLFELAHAN